MTFLLLPCFPSFGEDSPSAYSVPAAGLWQGTRGSSLCSWNSQPWKEQWSVWDTSDTEARRGQRGPMDWQRVPCGKPRRESSSGRSNCSAKTPWWEHARHAWRAGQGSGRKEMGLGGVGEVGRGHLEDLAGVERVERRSAVSSEGLRTEVWSFTQIVLIVCESRLLQDRVEREK